MTDYTSKLEWDLLGRITMQTLCNATGETQADITLEELTALLKEKIRLQEELKTRAADAWQAGYEAGWVDYQECYEDCTRNPENPEDRTPNPYKED